MTFYKVLLGFFVLGFKAHFLKFFFFFLCCLFVCLFLMQQRTEETYQYSPISSEMKELLMEFFKARLDVPLGSLA